METILSLESFVPGSVDWSKYIKPIVPSVYYEERRHMFSEMVKAMKIGQMTATEAEGDNE